MNAVDPALLPLTAEVGDDGRLAVGGVDLCDLAEAEGTPLFVYDEAHLRQRCREAVELVERVDHQAHPETPGPDQLAV